MRRVAAIALVLLAARVLVVFGDRRGGDAAAQLPGARDLRRTPFSVIPGEDVKIAGVKVGKVDSLDVTPDQKAAVVLHIDRRRLRRTSAATPSARSGRSR